MKKLVILLTSMVFLTSVSSAFAIDQKGKIAIGGYGGYAFGFGGFFDKYEEGDFTYHNKTTYCLGGKIKYELTPNFALAGAVDYQAGEFVTEGYDIFWDVLGREEWSWTGILANFVYDFNPEAKTNPYLTAGIGYYIPSVGDSKPGLNVGMGVERLYYDNLSLEFGGRLHIIFTEWVNTTYFQIYAGLIFYPGGK
jgi:opacity protein-like surface antigen